LEQGRSEYGKSGVLKVILRHVAFLFGITFASTLQAQSVEERLVQCIEESQRIIRFAEAVNKGAQELGQSDLNAEIIKVLETENHSGEQT